MATYLHLTDVDDKRHELQNVEDIRGVEVDGDGDTVIYFRHGGKTYVHQTPEQVAKMLTWAGHRIIDPPEGQW